MYVRSSRGRGVGQVSSTLLAAPIGVDTATPANAPVGISCAAGSGSACSWYDNIWATQGCLDWYAQCDPTNPFYVTSTQGLIVGGAQVIGSTVGNALVSGGEAAAATTGVPVWAWALGAGMLLLYVLPGLVKR